MERWIGRCMAGLITIGMYGRMDMWVDECMAEWINVSMDVCMDTYVRLYGCIFILMK